ncbi:60S ribosomal protein L22 [Savitreella phatthalungensis]
MAPQTAKKVAQTKKITLDATQPVADKIFDIAAFEKFLNDRVKVDGRTNNLGDVVKISREGEGKIVLVAHGQFSGRYLKYLTKKFLKKHQLRDWLRVVATAKQTYTLKFYNVQMDGEQADEEADEE